MIMGTNHDEGTLFATKMSAVVPALHTPLADGDLDILLDHFFNSNATVNAMVDNAYPLSSYGNATQQIEVMLRDFFFLCPTSRALLAMSSYGLNVYLYQFVYKGDWIEDPSFGVYHTAELEFVFDNAWSVGTTETAADEAAARVGRTQQSSGGVCEKPLLISPPSLLAPPLLFVQASVDSYFLCT